MKIYLVIGECDDWEYSEFRIIAGYKEEERANKHAEIANKEIEDIKTEYVKVNGSINSIYHYGNEYKIEHDPRYTNGDWKYSVIETMLCE